MAAHTLNATRRPFWKPNDNPDGSSHVQTLSYTHVVSSPSVWTVVGSPRFVRTVSSESPRWMSHQAPTSSDGRTHDETISVTIAGDHFGSRPARNSADATIWSVPNSILSVADFEGSV